MTTIKEAGEALRGWIDNPLRNKWVRAKTREAAVVLALAVMEKALMVGSADHIDDYDAGAEALRREIEELR